MALPQNQTKVALYVRLSAEEVNEFEISINFQLQRLRTFAYNNRFQIFKEYIDQNIPRSVLYTPTLISLLSDAVYKSFEKTIIWSLDRLSVYGPKIEKLIREDLESNSIGLISVKDNFDSRTNEGKEFLRGFGSANALTRKRASERYEFTMRKRATIGLVVQHWMPYGYKKSDDGQRRWAINDKEAATIKKIFGWHLNDNLSTRNIARRLTEAGIPTKRSKSHIWTQGSVRKILKNSSYYGIGKFSNSTFDIPIIIPKVDWEKAQEGLTLRVQGKPDKKSRFFLLRGVLFCSICGKKLYGEIKTSKLYASYRCSSRKASPFLKSCGLPSLRMEDTDKIIWQRIVALYQISSIRRPRANANRFARRESIIKIASKIDVSWDESRKRYGFKITSLG